MVRLGRSRFMLAAILLLSCSLIALRQLPHRDPWAGTDDEITAPVSVPLTRDTKPTIVKPSEDWMKEASSVELKATAESSADLDREPPDVPYLPPPLHVSRETPSRLQ